MRSLPIISMESTILDLEELDPERLADLEPEDSDDKEPEPLFPKAIQVQTADDLVDSRGFIIYEECLRELARCVPLPLEKCPQPSSDGKKCSGLPPFEVLIHPRGTAAVVEWVSNRSFEGSMVV